MHVPEDKCKKLNAKAIEIVFVGYESGSKGYRVWDCSTHSLKVSRDVTFDEASFPSWPPFGTSEPSSSQTTLPPPPIHFYPAPAEPTQSAVPLESRAPSPVLSTSSEDNVEDLIEPKNE